MTAYEPGRIGDERGADVRVVLDMDLGEAVGVDAHCYAVEGAYRYLHLLDPMLAHGLPSGSRVLFIAAWGEAATGRPRWGRLERVRDQELGPHVTASARPLTPVWRVRLDEDREGSADGLVMRRH